MCVQSDWKLVIMNVSENKLPIKIFGCKKGRNNREISASQFVVIREYCRVTKQEQ
jgi:hypothetical protein